MTRLLGAPVANAISEALTSDIARLAAHGVLPRLTLLRVGLRSEDEAYGAAIKKRFASAGALSSTLLLPEDASQEELEAAITALNRAVDVDGILLFRPLPEGLSQERLRDVIDPEKDADGMSRESLARVFAGEGRGYPPCTAQAVIELLRYYGVPIAGKRVTVVGRSLVVGRPLGMLLLAENATVTLCHTKTENLSGVCREADILVLCAGAPGMAGVDFTQPGQTVIDVGVSMKGGRLYGDADYEAVSAVAGAVSPVPGGVGSVTSAVLLKHTVEAAKKRIGL